MSYIGQSFNFNDVYYDEEMCRKISIAIKKSKIFNHVKPINLLKKKLNFNNIETFDNNNLHQNIFKNKNPRKLGAPIITTSLLPNPIFLKSIQNKNQIFQTKNSNELNSEKSILKNTENIPKEENKSNLKQSEIINNEIIGGKIINNEIIGGKIINNEIIGQKMGDKNILNFLPSPESFFNTNLADLDKSTLKTEFNDVDRLRSSISDQRNVNHPIQEELHSRNSFPSKIPDNVSQNIISSSLSQKSIRKEKQNRNLFSLATILLPLPSQLNDKQSIIIALQSGNMNNFIELFKECIKIENEISPNDLKDIIDAIVKEKRCSILSDLCDCLEFTPLYSQSLSESFIKHISEMKDFSESILNCLGSMMDSDSTILSFIEACFCVNDWNKMWSVISTKYPTYKFDEKYFNACMDVFQNLKSNSVLINHDTMLIIISYIMRNYYDNYEMYMADIWLYCVLITDINQETDLKVPPQILNKVIDKLVVMKNPSFMFIVKLLSKNWSLISNNTFCSWLSQMIADKNDVLKCLVTVKESMEAINLIDAELNSSFILLVLNVMLLLNKKSLFVCTKNVYETLLKNKSSELKALFNVCVEKFKYKWVIIETLVSTSDYKDALNILKEFDILKDFEKSFSEYNRVKEVLPNIIMNLLNTQNQISHVIDLFEKTVSIFIFNEPINNNYNTKCSEIFDVIASQTFISNDRDTVTRVLSLLDHILTAESSMLTVSQQSLRYLLVAAVKTNIPFNELLDITDACFKQKIFNQIQTSADGFGCFINLYSNLTTEEISVLITWICRHVKIKLVELAQQSQTASSNIMRDNLMKVCSINFVVRPRDSLSDALSLKLGASYLFNDFISKFTELLTNPRYLSHPIKFTINNDIRDEVKITCDNKIVYNAIYYSDI